MSRFNAGDRVVAREDIVFPELRGKHGRVLELDTFPWVEFDEAFDGGVRCHSFKGADGRCKAVPESALDHEAQAEVEMVPVEDDPVVTDVEVAKAEAPEPAPERLHKALQDLPQSDEPLTHTASVIDAATAYAEACRRNRTADVELTRRRHEFVKAQDESEAASKAMHVALEDLKRIALGRPA